MLQEIAPLVWALTRPLRALGFQLGTRMTVLRCDDGLVVISAIDPSPDEKAAIDALGPVRAIVVPNRMHSLFFRKAKAAWPEAALYGPAAIRAKAKDLSWSEGRAPAADAVESLPFLGAPLLDEVALYHRPSGTLVVTDIVFHYREVPGWWTGAYLRAQNVVGRLGQTWVMRSAIGDKKAARHTADRLIELDPKRIVMAHGVPWEGDGRDALTDAFRWLG
jgi:hypothetical protein